MKTKEQIEAHRRLCEHFNDTLLGDGRTCCTADLRALPTYQDPCGDGTVYPCENDCPYMKIFLNNQEITPVIEVEEPDKYGRTVKIGIKYGSTACFLQVMSVQEVEQLRDELSKFLSKNKSPECFYIPEVSIEEIRARVKVGDTVKVRFEEFGMPDKHIPGRVIHPKRLYRLIKVEERRGSHLAGVDTETGRSYRFNINQIIHP